MNKKIIFNYRLAQSPDIERTDPTSKVVDQPGRDLPRVLSTEGQTAVFDKLKKEAEEFAKKSGSQAFSDFFSNPERSLQFSQLDNFQRRTINNILNNESSLNLQQRTPANTNVSTTGNSSYNQAKQDASAYGPYLQQVNDSEDGGNNLLYLAAISSFGFPTNKGENVDHLYTEQNKNRIQKRLLDITGNKFIQKKYPKIPLQLTAALSKLDSKVQENINTSTEVKPTGGGRSDSGKETATDSTSESAIGRVPGEMPTAFDPNVNNFSNEARTILQEIDDAEIIAKSDEQKFKRQWPGISDNLRQELQTAIDLNKINIPEKSDIETKLENLDNKYFEIYYPGGFKRLGGGKIVPLTPVEAKDDLVNQLQVEKDNEKVSKLIDKFKKYFLQADRQTVRSDEKMQFLKEVNLAIQRRNNTRVPEDRLPLVNLTDYDINK